MFSGDQSDVQEFFLFLMEEISKELSALSGQQSDDHSDGEWEEVGAGGRSVLLTRSVMDSSLVSSLFETQLRKNVRSLRASESRDCALLETRPRRNAVLPHAVASYSRRFGSVFLKVFKIDQIGGRRFESLSERSSRCGF